MEKQSSDYIGVYKNSNRRNVNTNKCWESYVYIKADGKNKRIVIGTGKTQNEAAIKRNNYIIKHKLPVKLNTIIDDEIHNQLNPNREGYTDKQRIRKNVPNYPKTKEECIERILSNNTPFRDKKQFIEDDKIIIQFLNGNNDSIGKLFEKYLPIYKRSITQLLHKRSKIIRGRKIESEIGVDDFIQDGILKLVKLINEYKYTGGSFCFWFIQVILNLGNDFFRKIIIDNKHIKRGSFDYDKAWNNL